MAVCCLHPASDDPVNERKEWFTKMTSELTYILPINSLISEAKNNTFLSRALYLWMCRLIKGSLIS